MSALPRTLTSADLEMIKRRKRQIWQEQKQALAEGVQGPFEQLMEHLRTGDVSEKAAAAIALARFLKHLPPPHTAIIIASGGIASLMALATHGAPDGQEKAALALATYGQANATKTAVIEAGGLAPIVALAEDGPPGGKQWAAQALEHIARSSSGRSAIVNNGGISSLVKLLNLEEVAGHERRRGHIRAASVRALAHLACDDAHKAAVTAAAWKPLVEITTEMRPDSATCNAARRALANLGLGDLRDYLSQLQSKNASLQRRLNRYEGHGAIDLTGDSDDAAPEHRDKRLRTELDQASKARLVEVKEEKVAAERACDRTDAVTAAASAAAATEKERADDQGTNAMYLTAQKSALQRLVSDAANALLDAEVPTNEVSDKDAPFYYMLESHRDDNKQTLPWNPYENRPMTLAEGIHWIRNNQIAGGCRRRR